MHTKIIILAAGHGSRMKADKPKVLHTLGGQKILSRIIDTANSLLPEDILVLYGYHGERVRADISHKHKVTWVFQEQQLGTAHAVGLAASHIDDNDRVIILAGDVPLITSETLNQLLSIVSVSSMGIITQDLANPFGYGRIKRDDTGSIIGIVEEKDATEVERAITEINTGIMVIPGEFLKRAIPQITNDNAQQEYYLTDIIEIAHKEGLAIGSIQPKHGFEVKGVNTKQQLAELEREYQLFLAQQYMANEGVCFADPRRVDFRGGCQFGMDVSVDINVIFEGKNSVGANCKIGANCILKNTTLEDGVSIEPMSVLENVIVRKNATIGPYARLRPGSDIGECAKVGNFVEVKNSTIAKDSKASHLSYIGDAHIGEQVNIGAGTITCNYDGVNKSITEIQDGAFIGSNTSLVAPVTIARNSTIGAGSTIVKNTPANKLSLTRAKQLVIEKWKRPIKK